MRFSFQALFVLVGIGLSACCFAQVTGAGSSAAKPLYASWGEAYKKATGITVEYDPAGSSAGIKKIAERSVDFGATDVPMSAGDMAKNGVICVPTAVTGVVPIVNLPGRAGSVTLDGQVLAGIYSGKIKRWNDPAIATLNGGGLPDLAIKPFGRSDGSGTTYNFVSYLAKSNADWNSRFGVNFTIQWVAEVNAVKGSDEMVTAIQKTSGAIGYVDYAYVADRHLNFTKLKNRSGQSVEPNFASFTAALTNSNWKTKAAFDEMLTDTAGSESWPITAGTFVLLPSSTNAPDKTVASLKFLSWAFLHGDALAKQAGYVRLNDSLQAIVFGVFATITDKSGKKLSWTPF